MIPTQTLLPQLDVVREHLAKQAGFQLISFGSGERLYVSTYERVVNIWDLVEFHSYHAIYAAIIVTILWLAIRWMFVRSHPQIAGHAITI
jgi:hypothetical protein